MTIIDVNGLSLAELKQLEKDLAKMIANYEDRKKAEARAVLEEKARELGFKLSDLATERRVKGKSAPKYRHPENQELTWTGRGRKPKWVAEHIAAGKPIEELEI